MPLVTRIDHWFNTLYFTFSFLILPFFYFLYITNYYSRTLLELSKAANSEKLNEKKPNKKQ